MENEVKKPEILPFKDVMDIRMKKVEIIKKLDEVKAEREKLELTLEKMRLENLNLRKTDRWLSPLGELLQVAQLWYIDNGRSLGTEPALRSVWDDEEMNEIRDLILKKARKL